ncbi:DUF4232 domain-containing protein [Streptomyces sp. NPDC090022]|uniref:DUF4232 domain-containing protein n=1 Tax=Streptomyces sp. NPDC090022 TaxID=3365920 RepID=UPI00381D4408
MITNRWIRRLAGAVGAVAVAGVLAGCETAPAPERAAGPTAAPPADLRGLPPASSGGAGGTAGASGAPAQAACPADGVRLSEGGGDAAMGLRVESVELTNCGTEPYVLNGFPDIRLLDKKKGPVQVDVGHGSHGVSTVDSFDEAPQQVTLRPGQTASFGLLWRNLVTEVNTPAVDGWHIDVQPRPGAPRQTLALTRPVDLGTTGRLGLGPWKASGR